MGYTVSVLALVCLCARVSCHHLPHKNDKGSPVIYLNQSLTEITTLTPRVIKCDKNWNVIWGGKWSLGLAFIKFLFVIWRVSCVPCYPHLLLLTVIRDRRTRYKLLWHVLLYEIYFAKYRIIERIIVICLYCMYLSVQHVSFNINTGAKEECRLGFRLSSDDLKHICALWMMFVPQCCTLHWLARLGHARCPLLEKA